MKENTGLMLSEVRGPLKNLLDNLSGENADYWLNALKKMLRKEEFSKTPNNSKEFIAELDFREKSMKKLEEWIELLNALPAVCEASICSDGNKGMIDIEVHPNFNQFLNNEKNRDGALFLLLTNGNVERIAVATEITDETFNKCFKNIYKDIYEFYKALIKLGEMYYEAIPSPLVKK